jgi:hypothetical protein
MVCLSRALKMTAYLQTMDLLRDLYLYHLREPPVAREHNTGTCADSRQILLNRFAWTAWRLK